jgi:hypothetical protein
VLAALSLFGCMREQVDVVGNHDEIAPQYAIYAHLSNTKNIVTAGNIMILLFLIDMYL